MRRTNNFHALKETPEKARPAYAAIREFTRGVRRAQRDLAIEAKKVLRNADLTPEARQRRIADLSTKVEETIRPLEAECFAKIDAARTELRKVVDGYLDRDPIPPVPDGADAATQALALRSETVARLLARQAADQLLEKALAADPRGDGGALAEILGRALRSEDPIVASLLETRGLERIRAEGTRAQVTVAEEVINAAREGRLNDAGKRYLDHIDVLGECEPILQAVVVDTRSPKFLEGEAPGLTATVVLLGDELAGIE